MKRGVSGLLAAILLLALLPFSAAAQQETGYRDVAAEEWYAWSVGDVTKRGLMIGVGDGLFAPEAELSRAMTATVLWRLAGEPAVTEVSRFADVPEDTWYTVPVAWADEQEIALGYGDGLFGPDDPVTREQLAVFLYRFARDRGYDVSAPELDADPQAWNGSDWSRDAMAWAKDRMFFNYRQVRLNYGGMMGSGSTGYSLCPEETALRGETAVFLSRFSRMYLDEAQEEARVRYRPVSDQSSQGGYIWDFMRMELPEYWQGNFNLQTAAFDGVPESVSFAFIDRSSYLARTSGGYLFNLILYPENMDSARFGSWETLGDAEPGKSGRVCTVDAGPVMGRLCLYVVIPREGADDVLGRLYDPQQPGNYLRMQEDIRDILNSIRFDGEVKVVDTAPGFEIPLD